MYKTFSIISALILFAGVAYYFIRSEKEVPTQTTTTAQSTSTALYHRDTPDGLLEYRSIDYKFSLIYPPGLSVNERSEGAGATTITFQNAKRGDGFQIFVTPYTEQEVSAERFSRDNPSGLRESESQIKVDGATGIAFYSSDSTLGTTREVWFIHNGFLFEITTLKSLEKNLKDILETWRFVYRI